MGQVATPVGEAGGRAFEVAALREKAGLKSGRAQKSMGCRVFRVEMIRVVPRCRLAAHPGLLGKGRCGRVAEAEARIRVVLLRLRCHEDGQEKEKDEVFLHEYFCHLHLIGCVVFLNLF